ncbi:hypothetical protein ROLI_015240 [Roseobacter fucihabitans]|uniref:FAS1-like dehydratase domain-containing protein n=1 Tax=Roseobacter fucihabitans TaxID=1537242 RepID=A0ABZ2BU90_9RHOB|nr:MaoC family dehydratase N-terminal domain-containing protein [Roseobacter litoralis]MBC6965433.1 hypothetical protein [Roseobacter litoralis]
MSLMDGASEIAMTNSASGVGRKEQHVGVLSLALANMVHGAVAHGLSAACDIREGAPMPHLWHWAGFPETVPLSELARNGHPAMGGFLPELSFERRMWAGGHLRFSGRLHIGEPLHRSSEILAVTRKAGATGEMVFITVQHVVTGEAGGRVDEVQDIVYLDIPDRFTAPKKKPVPQDLLFDETVTMNEVRLFRFSAATYNAHRIHYDLDYTRKVEKYPALIVHGPMQAMMLLDAGERHSGKSACGFRFRGVHPMFHDQDLRLTGTVDLATKAMVLGTAAPAGFLGMQARMEWA